MATSDPGYEVWAVKVKAAATMAASPLQVSTAAIDAGIRLSQGVPTATRAPRASSQARVNGEK